MDFPAEVRESLELLDSAYRTGGVMCRPACDIAGDVYYGLFALFIDPHSPYGVREVEIGHLIAQPIGDILEQQRSPAIRPSSRIH